MFYDTVIIMYDIITPNPYQYTAKSVFVGVRSTNEMFKDK